MEKNNQPLILGIVVIGAVLIIALALIFTRSGDETATEPASENNVSENAENGNGGDNGGDNQQPVPTPAPQPTPQPIPTPNPTPVPTPAPQPGILPSDWDNLTDREKTDLNPFNCDHKTQWVSAEDGTCINKPPTDPQAACDVLQLTLDPQTGLCTQSNDIICADWQTTDSSGNCVEITLPANWDSLTYQEKLELNPHNCNILFQSVSSSDGTCIDEPCDTGLIPGECVYY